MFVACLRTKGAGLESQVSLGNAVIYAAQVYRNYLAGILWNQVRHPTLWYGSQRLYVQGCHRLSETPHSVLRRCQPFLGEINGQKMICYGNSPCAKLLLPRLKCVVLYRFAAAPSTRLRSFCHCRWTSFQVIFVLNFEARSSHSSRLHVFHVNSAHATDYQIISPLPAWSIPSVRFELTHQ